MINKLKYSFARYRIRKNLAKILRSSRFLDANILLLNVPSHGNLGDHLISLAEKQLLKDITGSEPFTISTGQLYYGFDIVQNFIRPQQTLVITGGGYLGSVWPEEERRICRILTSFPDNKILIMPQTIFYENEHEAKRLLEYAQHCYQSHKNLHLCLREIESYKEAMETLLLPEKMISLQPDAALYLNLSEPIDKRHGVILCLRNDKELLKGQGQELKNEFIERIKEKYDCTFLDTLKPYAIPQEKEDSEIQQFATTFKRAKLVVTDRLHGMIYAAITGTPVIAFDNTTHKIRNVYSAWMSSFKHVKFADESTDLIELLKWSDSISPVKYQNNHIKQHLQSIINYI